MRAAGSAAAGSPPARPITSPSHHTPTAVTTRRGAQTGASPWWPASPSKRWAEKFFLAYSPVWITWALCILVPFQLYEVGRAGWVG